MNELETLALIEVLENARAQISYLFFRLTKKEQQLRRPTTSSALEQLSRQITTLEAQCNAD